MSCQKCHSRDGGATPLSCQHAICDQCLGDFLERKFAMSLLGCPLASCSYYSAGAELLVNPADYEKFLAGDVLAHFRATQHERFEYEMCRSMANDPLSGTLSEILEGFLYLGGEGQAIDAPTLRSQDIRVVINMAQQCKCYHADDNSFTYHHLPILDEPGARLPLDEALAVIMDAYTRGQRVFVHCIEGRSRSASIVIAYMMKTRRLSYADALSKVVARRVIVRPNEGFELQLREYEKLLRVKRVSKSLSSFPIDPALVGAALLSPVSFNEITTGLYLGDQRAAGHFPRFEDSPEARSQAADVMRSLGVKLVVVCPNYPEADRFKLGTQFEYLYLGLLDSPAQDLTPALVLAFAQINATTKSGHSVFVHCNAGASRSASIIIGYLMVANRWSYEKAATYARSKRPVVSPNNGFERQLLLWEANIVDPMMADA